MYGDQTMNILQNIKHPGGGHILQECMCSSNLQMAFLDAFSLKYCSMGGLARGHKLPIPSRKSGTG